MLRGTVLFFFFHAHGWSFIKDLKMDLTRQEHPPFQMDLQMFAKQQFNTTFGRRNGS